MNEPFAEEYLAVRALTRSLPGILTVNHTGWFHTPVGPGHPIPVPKLEGPYVVVVREGTASNPATVVESFGSTASILAYIEKLFRDAPGDWKVLGIYDGREGGRLIDWVVTRVDVKLFT